MRLCIPASKSVVNASLLRHSLRTRIIVGNRMYIPSTCGNLRSAEFLKTRDGPCIHPFGSIQFRCAHGMSRPRTHRERKDAWPRERFEKPHRRVEALRDLDFTFHPMFPLVGGRWAGWETHWERAKQRLVDASEEEMRRKRTPGSKRLKKDDASSGTSDAKHAKSLFKSAWESVLKFFNRDAKK